MVSLRTITGGGTGDLARRLHDLQVHAEGPAEAPGAFTALRPARGLERRLREARPEHVAPGGEAAGSVLAARLDAARLAHELGQPSVAEGRVFVRSGLRIVTLAEATTPAESPSPPDAPIFPWRGPR